MIRLFHSVALVCRCTPPPPPPPTPPPFSFIFPLLFFSDKTFYHCWLFLFRRVHTRPGLDCDRPSGSDSFNRNPGKQTSFGREIKQFSKKPVIDFSSVFYPFSSILDLCSILVSTNPNSDLNLKSYLRTAPVDKKGKKKVELLCCRRAR